MLDPNRRLLSRREIQCEAMRLASTYAHFSQNQPLYLNKAVGTPLNAYEWAVADYFGKPRVKRIDICQWDGGIGQPIWIEAWDNLMVLRVCVKIRDTSLVLEQGEAKQSKTDRSLWMYTTRTAIQPKPGVWLDVVANDLPGNSGENFLVLK